MRFEIEGLNEVEKSLKNLKRKVGKLAGKNEVRFTKLFNPDFMKRYTIFSSIEEFFNESEWEVESREDIEEIPEEELDEYVEEKTKFKSWKHMLSVAAETWIKKELG